MMMGCARFPCGGHAGGCSFADCGLNPNRITYPGALPAPQQTTPLGCICPPTSEKSCESPICPRKNRLSAKGTIA